MTKEKTLSDYKLFFPQTKRMEVKRPYEVVEISEIKTYLSKFIEGVKRNTPNLVFSISETEDSSVHNEIDKQAEEVFGKEFIHNNPLSESNSDSTGGGSHSPKENVLKQPPSSGDRVTKCSPAGTNAKAEKKDVVILDDNELSLSCYAEEYPENWKKICKGLEEQGGYVC